MAMGNFVFHLGKYIMLIWRVFSKPEKFSIYRRRLFDEMITLGLDSLGIIMVISVFMGAVITIQTAANIDSAFIPTYTIGFTTRQSTILEFSPTIMALILAGKVGSNIASEIGTMRISKLQVQTLSDGNFNASGNNIVGVTTGAEYEVDTISLAETITNAAKGVITDSSGVGSTVELNVRRTSFNTQFTIGGGSIVGSTSGASGALTDATQNPATRAMGDNAVLTARATVADNIASELTIVDSGVGFVEGEQVTLQTTGNPIIITANTRLGTAGTQEGYWKTEKHFTSSDQSIIQDNNFYQEYSYVVKTGVSLSRYEEVLKDILHVAGTRLFGEVLKVAELDTQITIANSSITADV